MNKFCRFLPSKNIAKKWYVIGVIVGGLAIVAISIWLLRSPQPSQEPSFPVLEPPKSHSQQRSDWQRPATPSSDQKSAVYVYTDNLQGVTIHVSQQQLPDSFTASPAQSVKELAKSFNATEKLSAGAITAYLGTSSDGPQSVIFTAKGLLVFIKSDQPVSTTAWSDYIESLQFS